MSPASSGPLEIERYIGACLISSHHRNKGAAQNPASGNSNVKGCNGRDVYYPRESYVPDMYNGGGYVTLDGRYRPPRRCNSVDGWAGGMPLISFANSQRRNRRPNVVDVTRCSSPRVTDDVQQHNPLSRLAVHTQGLPLILSGKHGNRRSKAARQMPQGRGVVDAAKKIGECKDNTVNGVDSLSVASDESSGSNNSENSLPRIIKPRKRRKKDRKPHPTRSAPTTSDEIVDHHQDGCTGSSSIVTLKPYVPYCYERYTRDRGVYVARNNTSSSDCSNVDVSERTVRRANVVAPDTCKVEVQKGSNNIDSISSSSSCSDLISETPQLHHRFEDVVGGLDGDGDNCEPSSCQCRYCDPAGQIWDVDRHCYSPFLTSPTFSRHVRPTYADTSVPAMMSPRKQHQFSERISSALQSQCLISAFSLDLEDISVRNCKDAEVCRPLPNRIQQQCLEISTTIVTSPNGHRDLEIRLFSTSSPVNDDRPPKYNAREHHRHHSPELSRNNKLIDKCDELCLINDDYGRLTPEE